MSPTYPDDFRHPLPVGRLLREGQVVAMAGMGWLGPVYKVHARPTGTPAPGRLAVREFMPLGLCERNGSVVRARPGLEDTFAAARLAFEADAGRLAALANRGSVVQPVALWHENGTTYRAGAWSDDPVMSQVVDQSGGLIPQDLLESWMRTLAETLTPLHRGRAVHGHIDPRRVRLPPNGRPRLPSPGLCRGLVAQALAGDVLAKCPFAAPEQLERGSRGPVGPWTDIYALAGLLYHAITAQWPQPAAERLAADRLQPLAPLAGREYAHHFLRAIDRALSLDPAQRPHHLAQWLAALGIRERRQHPRGRSGGLLTNLPVPHTQELDIDIDIDIGSFGSLWR